MIIEVNFSNLLFIIFAIIGALWALMKVIANQSQRITNTRFEAHESMENKNHSVLGERLDNIEALHRQDANQWQRVERELLTLKADLPVHYVRREDYIRGQSVIEAKLDGLATKIENQQLRGTYSGVPHAN